MGEKVVLWDGGNADSTNYGIGVQPKLLQFHTDLAASDIVLGYGSSAAFVEKFRFKGIGYLGIGTNFPQFYLDINGPIRLRYNPSKGTGLEFNNAAGPKMGIVANGLWSIYANGYESGSMYMNTTTGNIGVGTLPSDTYPLILGYSYDDFYDGMQYYPGSIAFFDAGGIKLGTRADAFSLYIEAIGANTDIAIGYDQYLNNTFNERFAVKQSGALAIMGNTGAAGQRLRSNGPNAPAQWFTIGTNTNFQPEQIVASSAITISNNNLNLYNVPGLTKEYTIATPANVRINYSVSVESPSCAFCGNADFEIIISDRVGNYEMVVRDQIENGRSKTMTGSFLLNAPSGLNYVDILVRRINGPALKFGYIPDFIKEDYMIFEIAD